MTSTDILFLALYIMVTNLNITLSTRDLSKQIKKLEERMAQP